VEQTKNEVAKEAKRRRTFAIISHPDAGKTTLTEKLLLFGGAIQAAGTVKSRKSSKFATSDWMAIEKERGISVASSVMQFEYRDCVINLLDTPGHRDFSEDTYRVLTAVDAALMVIDCTKGVESGIYDIARDETLLFDANSPDQKNGTAVKGLSAQTVDEQFSSEVSDTQDEVNLIREDGRHFDKEHFLEGELTPVFFGSAMNNFGVVKALEALVEDAPSPRPRPAIERSVEPEESNFSAFVFKIQANMDPQHRDRIAFLRVCSGRFSRGMKLLHVRSGKEIRAGQVVSFLSQRRETVEDAWPGDIIGLLNHGSIDIGDTFSVGESLSFTGIPYFAPELFQGVTLKDPLKGKQLQKGLQQLGEEGAIQVFKPTLGNEMILGAVGLLQFEVVSHRLKVEYGVEASTRSLSFFGARWITASDKKKLAEFERQLAGNLAHDASGSLAFLATSKPNLDLTMERWPDIEFHSIREHAQKFAA